MAQQIIAVCRIPFAAVVRDLKTLVFEMTESEIVASSLE